jgi:hypothetical protein
MISKEKRTMNVFLISMWLNFWLILCLSLSLFLLFPFWSIGHPWNALFHFSFLILRQSVWLLGRGISPSQGLYLNTGQHKHRKTHTHIKHPCPKWDSNPRSQRPRERRQFMHQTAQLRWPASVRASEDSSCISPLSYGDRHPSSTLRILSFSSFHFCSVLSSSGFVCS